MSAARAKILEKHDDDVVIVSAIRSAMTKSKKGGFKDTRPEEILMNVLKHAYTSTKLDPTLIEDIVVGNVLPPSGGASAARMAAIAAGIPIETPITTVNRQCSSGLTAVNQIANSIKAGQIDIGIGAGVESMTFGYGPGAMPDNYSELVLETQEAEDCLIPMGITSENVAADYNISREAQDTFAALSFQKAAAAQKANLFGPEILPIRVKQVSPDGGKQFLVDHDDGVRDGVTAESLAKLKPAFKKDGSTHAGNASQVSDGAAAVLLARRSVAKKLGLPIVGKFVAAQAVGVPPRIMGVGPAFAIPHVLKKTGLELSDIDFFEINEAFASQALFCCEKLGIPWKEAGLNGKVNRWGGAIAIGHPLGCTGARQIATGLNIAKHDNEKVFVTSMCIGSGMGMAGVFVNEQ
ncbi:acetyl-CoA acetyl transferase [Lentinula raphanica]|uniref:Acetyl-CoA acetyl transferase n=1 Tax=Lentinula raphanica TaxID=153919 RepID=A0AA38P779_9AGAR|nr:acetyl-CoA acetyl transferase [Lentinula raphanica]KAJ3837589.1 acetyl-CoA acetyl transferase [Lentinula raphanica]KAJ3970148.1 acetyl-CoA acetyl transferase [Lentinula raphanica]